MMYDAEKRRELERQSWQYRAIQATAGPLTQPGALLLAILGKQRATRPQFGSTAKINSAGYIVTSFTSKSNVLRLEHAVCTVDQFVMAFRKLADLLKLNDAERGELFAAIRLWIAKDERPIDKRGLKL